MSYEMIWEDRGLLRRFFGESSDLEVYESVQRTHASERFDEIRYVIVDLSEIKKFTLNSADNIEEIAAIDAASALSNPMMRIAIVTTDPDIKRCAQIYLSHPLAPYPTRIFDKLADARGWLIE